ncbi:hypothetical protein B0O44_105320 [Pedobacter nutrimenti]|uniref:Uncharacterized protein n=1 Tax=Pedobacter nutrimenti TaxID=1241337 RepID=A0A318UBM0_9SPHI|nr:hypothetical protein B0O44_105320 [Pedobacter nutrimenti]
MLILMNCRYRGLNGVKWSGDGGYKKDISRVQVQTREMSLK